MSGGAFMARETVRFKLEIQYDHKKWWRGWFETHAYSHADEILAFLMIQRRGTKAFIDKFAKDKVITVGTGGGPLDDHKFAGEKASSSGLVGAELKLLRDPHYGPIIAHVHKNDTTPGADPFDVCTIIKLMGQMSWDQNAVMKWAYDALYVKANEVLDPRYHGDKKTVSKDFSLQYIGMLAIAQNPEQGHKWLAFGAEAKAQDNLAFHVGAAREFKEKAVVKDIMTVNGRARLCVIESDNHTMARFARSAFGARATVTVIKNSKGNVTIHFDREALLDIGDLCAMLRLEEQRCRGFTFCDDPEKLRAEGMLDQDLDVWHNLRGHALLNGSFTARGISPTAIPLESIVSIIEIALDPKCFDSTCAPLCQTGICPAKAMDAECEFACYGFSRCRAIQKASMAA